MTKLQPLAQVQWHKSSFSNGGDGGSNCVEVAFTRQSVHVRHSRRPDGLALSFTLAEWEAFLAGVRNEEFDLQSPEGPRPSG